MTEGSTVSSDFAQEILTKLGETTVGCYFGSLISLGKTYSNVKNKEIFGVLGRFKHTFISPFFFQTSLSFCTKVLVDNFWQWGSGIEADFQKGGLVGLTSFLLNTPIVNINKVQKKESTPSNRVSKSQALSLMINKKGLGSLYGGQLLVNSLSSIIFYSLYFGGYEYLCTQTENNNLYNYFINPLGASTVASISSIILGWVSNYRRNLITNTKAQVIKLNKSEIIFRLRVLASNWFLLSIFLMIKNTYGRKLDLFQEWSNQIQNSIK